MTNPIDSERRISRRFKLRDLHVLAVVDRHGSISQAAKDLGMAQPSVSEMITGMEDILGVRLLDRSPRGVQMTPYGRALLRRARVAFDELGQAVREIQYLSDPSVGEVRFSCPESISASLLPSTFDRPLSTSTTWNDSGPSASSLRFGPLIRLT